MNQLMACCRDFFGFRFSAIVAMACFFTAFDAPGFSFHDPTAPYMSERRNRFSMCRYHSTHGTYHISRIAFPGTGRISGVYSLSFMPGRRDLPRFFLPTAARTAFFAGLSTTRFFDDLPVTPCMYMRFVTPFPKTNFQFIRSK